MLEKVEKLMAERNIGWQELEAFIGVDIEEIRERLSNGADDTYVDLSVELSLALSMTTGEYLRAVLEEAPTYRQSFFCERGRGKIQLMVRELKEAVGESAANYKEVWAEVKDNLLVLGIGKKTLQTLESQHVSRYNWEGYSTDQLVQSLAIGLSRCVSLRLDAKM